MKDKIIEIIRRVCSHWIVADEDELNRVSEELESELKSLYTTEISEEEIATEMDKLGIYIPYERRICRSMVKWALSKSAKGVRDENN